MTLELPDITCGKCGALLKDHTDIVEEHEITIQTRHISDPEFVSVETPALNRHHRFYCENGEEFE